MRRNGFLLPVTLVLMLIASVMSVVLIKDITNMSQILNSQEREASLRIQSENVFFALLGMFQSVYSTKGSLNPSYLVFNENSPNENPNWLTMESPEDDWFSPFFDSFDDSYENLAWKELFEMFGDIHYSTSILEDILINFTDNLPVNVVILRNFESMLLVFVRVRNSANSTSNDSIFWGLITPKYFSNWAVFYRDGISSSYGWDEMIDGPSYYGGSIKKIGNKWQWEAKNGIGSYIMVPPLPGQEESPWAYAVGATFSGKMQNVNPWGNKFNLSYIDPYSVLGKVSVRLNLNDNPNWEYSSSNGAYTESDGKFYIYYDGNSPNYVIEVSEEEISILRNSEGKVIAVEVQKPGGRGISYNKVIIDGKEYTGRWHKYGDYYYIYYDGSSKPSKYLIIHSNKVGLYNNKITVASAGGSGGGINTNGSGMTVENLGMIFPWNFRMGVDEITLQEQIEMYSRFENMDNYYNSLGSDGKLPKYGDIIDLSFSASSLNGIYGFDFTEVSAHSPKLNNATLPDSIQHAHSYTIEETTYAYGFKNSNLSDNNNTYTKGLEIKMDVLTGSEIKVRYCLITNLIENTEQYSVQEFYFEQKFRKYELEYKNNKNQWKAIADPYGNNGSGFGPIKELALILVTPKSEFDNIPPWSGYTFLVIKNGENYELFDGSTIAAIEHYGLFTVDRNLTIGQGIIERFSGDLIKPEWLGLTEGRFTFVSKKGYVRTVSDIVYNDMYRSSTELKHSVDNMLPFKECNANLNELVQSANDMLNLVSIKKDVVMPYYENRNTKNETGNLNIKLFANMYAFGGKMDVEKYSNYPPMGYRHIFGTLVAKTSPNATYSPGSNNGFMEYNVYDKRLLANSKLPFATPESSKLMAYGFGMR